MDSVISKCVYQPTCCFNHIFLLVMTYCYNILSCYDIEGLCVTWCYLFDKVQSVVHRLWFSDVYDGPAFQNRHNTSSRLNCCPFRWHMRLCENVLIASVLVGCWGWISFFVILSLLLGRISLVLQANLSWASWGPWQQLSLCQNVNPEDPTQIVVSLCHLLNLLCVVLNAHLALSFCFLVFH